MRILALCFDCAHQHCIDFDPVLGPGAAFGDWLTKHPQHDVDFAWPGRSAKGRHLDTPYGQLLDNSDIKLAYGSASTPTWTLTSIAASTSLLGGRSSATIDNSTNLYLDYLLAGHYRTAVGSLQAGLIRTAVVGARDSTPTWPDVFDGTDSNKTVTTQGMYDSICRIAAESVTDATQRTWPFGPVSIESLFGRCPSHFLLFVSHTAHTTTAAWSSTPGDFAMRLVPVYATVI